MAEPREQDSWTAYVRRENKQLLAELHSARDEMDRQACLYAEASRHRCELLKSIQDACSDLCECTGDGPVCPVCQVKAQVIGRRR